ncbi:hypothetical protein [Halostreptopolyspora alba]|uniref:Uncharacterized protein n=1 Tax=Halostreptopolyspora alba TaxID=2487137 RepID=A0A3N0E6K0_9ACTN|nr:hypothetical protein EFW17_15805 [Nocardiopsaceae bacterium YIM 96095]
MRKPSTRWVALTGATTIAVAGLVIASGTATAADGPRPWPVVQHDASSYTLDGFVINYLPSGLERNGLTAKSATNSDGGRTSEITWHSGPDEVHGKITVIRDESITTLDELRETQYGHLNDEQLAEVDNKGRDTYLAEGTGDMFWVEDPGLAVTTYLAPDTWDADELARMAAGVERATTQDHERSGTAHGPDAKPSPVPDDQVSMPPQDTTENEAAGTRGDWGDAGDPPDSVENVSVDEIRACLNEQVADAARQGTEEGEPTPDEGSLGQRWRAADRAAREAAIEECAQRFDIDATMVDEAIVTLAESMERTESTDEAEEPATVRDALAWTIPAVPLNS